MRMSSNDEKREERESGRNGPEFKGLTVITSQGLYSMKSALLPMLEVACVDWNGMKERERRPSSRMHT